MKVLMLSTDTNILEEKSESRQRMVDYGGLVEELHIIVKNKKSKIKNQKFDNVFIYPTNDQIRLLYFINAYRISSSIIKNWKLKIVNCVITCQDPFETGLVGYLLKRKFHLPLQIQVHTDFLSPYFWKESTRNKIRIILGKWLIKKADGLRVVSERIRNSLCSKLRVSSSKISVLPIFVDIEKVKNASVRIDLHQKYPGQFIILMASRLTQEKNIGLAIGAMESVVKNNPKTLLLIVGDGPESYQLKTKSEKLKANVVIESWYDDLPSYYKTADLFLLTSNYEGYGRTVVEATAAGLPVLMTDVGVAIGSVVPVDDKTALVDDLNRLISNRAERKNVLENQKNILDFYNSKEDYLNRLKRSWSRCLASRILDSDTLSESEQNK